jgi:hypothetical protein
MPATLLANPFDVSMHFRDTQTPARSARRNATWRSCFFEPIYRKGVQREAE